MSDQPSDVLYNKQVTEIYDFWVGNGYYDYLKLSNEVAEIANKDDRILEIGIGTGSAAIPLAMKGFRIDGIDQSPFMLEKLNRKLAKQNLPIQTWQQSIENIDVPNKYDLIFSVGGPFWIAILDSRTVMHSYVNKLELPSVFKKISSLLKPRGKFMINIQRHGSHFENKLANGMNYRFTIKLQPDNYILKTHYFYKDGRMVIKQPYKMLQLDDDKVKALLKEAGLSEPAVSPNGSFWILSKI